MKRTYVPASIHDELVEALVEVARKVIVGDPLLVDDAQLGPLATKFQREKVARLVENALSNGGKAAIGGKAIDGPGYFYEPTIVTGVEDGMPIVDEEQFGPAMPIISYTDLDDAIERANASTFALGASVWTSDLDRGAEVGARIDAGSAWINTHAALAPNVPFGGHHWSGLGVENGPWGLHGFTEMQVLHTNRGVPGPGAL